MNALDKPVWGVGIVGAGRVSQDHANAVENIDGLELLAVAEPNDERRGRFVAERGCAGYADHRQLLARDDVNVILAGLPHWLHAPVAIDALQAGKHVLVEKPMAMTLAECDAMTETAQAHGVQLMVGHTQHFFPANIAARELLDRGEIGQVIMATETWYKPFGLASRPPWFLDRSKGGGMWWMNGAHMIDRLLWFIGSQISAVKGQVSNKVLKQNADDTIIALVEFANGVCATLVHSGSKRPEQPPPEQHQVGEITGTEGMLKTVPYQGEVWLNKDGEYRPVEVRSANPSVPGTARSVLEQSRGIVREVAAFVTALRSGGQPPVSNRHARAIVQALLAVEESSRTGREVRLG